jgi:hypothetical protein
MVASGRGVNNSMFRDLKRRDGMRQPGLLPRVLEYDDVQIGLVISHGVCIRIVAQRVTF